MHDLRRRLVGFHPIIRMINIRLSIVITVWGGCVLLSPFCFSDEVDDLLMERDTELFRDQDKGNGKKGIDNRQGLVERYGRKAVRSLQGNGVYGILGRIERKQLEPGRYRLIFDMGLEKPHDAPDRMRFEVGYSLDGKKQPQVFDYSSRHFPAGGYPKSLIQDFVVLHPSDFSADLRRWGTFPGNLVPCLFYLPGKIERIDKGVALVKFRSKKLVYKSVETGKLDIELLNTFAQDRDVVIYVVVQQDADQCKVIKKKLVHIKAGELLPLNLTFELPSREYGYRLEGIVTVDGIEMDKRYDYFNVSDNIWKVSIGSPGIRSSMHSAKSNSQTMTDDLEYLRYWYCNWWEKDFWAPCDWGDLTPDDSAYISGQARRFEEPAKIREFIDRSHQYGIAAITYGKQTGSGPSGWDIVRQHPDWFLADEFNRPVGSWDVWDFDHWIPQVAMNQNEAKKFSSNWHFNYPNLTRLDVLNHGINELLESTREFGWDGVRFDGHWFAGSQEMAVRNYQLLKKAMWKEFPLFVFGYNSDDPGNSPTFAQSRDFRERMAGIGHQMNEMIRHFRYYAENEGPNYYKSWRKYAEGMLADVSVCRQHGGTYHVILDAQDNYYKFILAMVAGAHTVYGDHAAVPGNPNWGSFLTRWSGLLYDVNLKSIPLEDLEKNIIVDSDALWWKEWSTERIRDSRTKQDILHLILPPVSDKIADPWQIPEPVKNVNIRVKDKSQGKLSKVFWIDTQSGNNAVELKVSENDGWYEVIVPEVSGWGMLVCQYYGDFQRPKPGKMMLAPADPENVSDAIKKAYKPLPCDPIRPELDPEFKAPGMSIVREIESIPLHIPNVKAVKDPDASGGMARVVDGSVFGTGCYFGHNNYHELLSGRYRATVRLKTPDKSKQTRTRFYASWYLPNQQKVTSPCYNVTVDDFKEDNQYQDFQFEFDFCDSGCMVTVSGFWQGHNLPGSIYFDKITLERIKVFDDYELAKLKKLPLLPAKLTPGKINLKFLDDDIKGDVDEIDMLNNGDRMIGLLADNDLQAKSEKAPDSDMRLQSSSVRVLMVCGLYYQYFNVKQSIPDQWFLNKAYAGKGKTGGYVRHFPENPSDLFQYNMIIVTNVDAQYFTLEQRFWINQFVKRGGGLLLLGGTHGFGQGSINDTFFQELIPVSVGNVSDCRQAKQWLTLKPCVDNSLHLDHNISSVLWKQSPKVLWRHLVRAKPGAVVQVKAGNDPMLVTWSLEKGRVAVFTGTVLGNPPDSVLPFWQWKGWSQVLNETFHYLTNNKRDIIR